MQGFALSWRNISSGRVEPPESRKQISKEGCASQVGRHQPSGQRTQRGESKNSQHDERQQHCVRSQGKHRIVQSEERRSQASAGGQLPTPETERSGSRGTPPCQPARETGQRIKAKPCSREDPCRWSARRTGQ